MINCNKKFVICTIFSLNNIFLFYFLRFINNVVESTTYSSIQAGQWLYSNKLIYS